MHRRLPPRCTRVQRGCNEPRGASATRKVGSTWPTPTKVSVTVFISLHTTSPRLESCFCAVALSRPQAVASILEATCLLVRASSIGMSVSGAFAIIQVGTVCGPVAAEWCCSGGGGGVIGCLNAAVSCSCWNTLPSPCLSLPPSHLSCVSSCNVVDWKR